MMYTTAFLEPSCNTDIPWERLVIFGVAIVIVVGVIAIGVIRSRQKISESFFETTRQYFNLAAQKDQLPEDFIMKDGELICGENSKVSTTKEADIAFQWTESPQVKLELKDKNEANT